MRFTSLFIILVLAAAGCTRIPQPASYAYSEQQKMQAVHHWDVLAWDVANQINNQLVHTDHIDTALFVKPTCSTDTFPCPPGKTTTFNESFHDLLKTRLYQFGIPTRHDPDTKAITVNYKVQVVYHRARRTAIQPGTFTALTSAIIVLRAMSDKLQALGAAAAVDIYNSTSPMAGHYEVIITTSMVRNNKYLFRSSDVYYINDKDFWHYQNSAHGSEIKIVASDPLPSPTTEPKL